MKIAVICANGKAGNAIVNEAISRGLDVTSVARGNNKTAALNFINKDLFDLNKKDLEGFDVIVDAFGMFDPAKLDLHTSSLKHLCDLISNTDTRLLIVGGAGSLYLDKEHKIRLMDSPDFPERFKPVASNMGKALDELRKRNDVKWTYISPAANFQPDGEKTGKYTLNGEEFTLNSKNLSCINYSDYAVGFVDEIIKAQHINKRISLNSL